MIPRFGPSGALPPYVGHSPTDPRGVSPYLTSMSEIAGTLAMTPERARLCKGLLEYRENLRNLGVIQGFQWIDGSFCEDVEGMRGRPPGDIDLVTLLVRPPTYQDTAAWNALVLSNLHVFKSDQAKARYRCEGFFIDLNAQGANIISQITYWFGLFSHQKVTSLWKGILQVDLVSDDAAASFHINRFLASTSTASHP